MLMVVSYHKSNFNSRLHRNCTNELLEAPDDILTPPDSPDASDLTDECGYKGRNRGRESGFACDIGFEEVAALGSDAEEMIDDVVAIVEDVTDEFVDDDAEEFVDDDTEDFDSNELSAK